MWFVPAGEPPHKRRGALSASKHRVAMTRLAIRGNPAFAVCTLEASRRGPSYTVDTLRALAAESPRTDWHLLLGADMYTTFDTWRDSEEIAARAVLVVASRPGTPAKHPAQRGRRVVWLTNPALEVSSHLLRARAAQGQGLRYLLPDAVARYVARHQLYDAAKRGSAR